MSDPTRPPATPWSMTGHGEGTAGATQASLRAVNGRYLEIKFRLPPALRTAEPLLEAWLRPRLGRGRVEVTLASGAAARGPDPERIAARLAAWKASGLVEAPLSLGDLLRLGGEGDEAESADETAVAESLAALEAAIVPFWEGRRREGAALRVAIRDLLARFRGELATVEREAAGAPAQLRDALVARLRELGAESGADPARLAQEVALLADRCDVTEELTRLRIHLDAVEALLESGEVGKKLDFYTQELGREVNTTGSKSRSAAIAGAVIEMKALLEKIREQAANLG